MDRKEKPVNRVRKGFRVLREYPYLGAAAGGAGALLTLGLNFYTGFGVFCVAWVTLIAHGKARQLHEMVQLRDQEIRRLENYLDRAHKALEQVDGRWN